MLIGKLFVIILLFSIAVTVLFVILKLVEANVSFYKVLKNRKPLSIVFGLPVSVVSAYLIYLIGSKALWIFTQDNVVSILVS